MYVTLKIPDITDGENIYEKITIILEFNRRMY